MLQKVLSDLSVEELRNELSWLGLDSRGLKDTLTGRLEQALRDDGIEEPHNYLFEISDPMAEILARLADVQEQFKELLESSARTVEVVRCVKAKWNEPHQQDGICRVAEPDMVESAVVAKTVEKFIHGEALGCSLGDDGTFVEIQKRCSGTDKDKDRLVTVRSPVCTRNGSVPVRIMNVSETGRQIKRGTVRGKGEEIHQVNRREHRGREGHTGVRKLSVNLESKDWNGKGYIVAVADNLCNRCWKRVKWKRQSNWRRGFGQRIGPKELIGTISLRRG